MPYISQVNRDKLTNAIDTLSLKIMGMGDFNYIISSLIDKWLEEEGVCYLSVNELMGMLECCKLELYRRVAAPYEDEKRNENGEVYTITEPKKESSLGSILSRTIENCSVEDKEEYPGIYIRYRNDDGTIRSVVTHDYPSTEEAYIDWKNSEINILEIEYT